MAQAAKFGDLVLGIDLHKVMVPGAPQPVPLPHPFIGVVYDPLGAAIGAAVGALAGGGGLVLINGSPVANTGTDVRGRPHLPMPPGVSFAPDDLPENQGTIVMGSKTVSMGGSSAGRLGSLVSSCGWPVSLPTSMCLAVPFGEPVEIGGPDSFDKMAAATRGIRTKWFSDKLGKILRAKPGSRLSRMICFLTGHPVDVMTGEVLTDAVDFELAGPIPIVFERSYWSRSTSEGPLGPGWSHPLDGWVQETSRGLVVRLADGREREHVALAPGSSLWDDLDRYTLARTARGYRLTTWDGLSYWFEAPAKAAATHPLVRITDRSDNEIVCRYDEGRLAEVVDSAGRVLRFVTKEGRLTAVRLRRRRAEDGWIELGRYVYEEGRLARAVDPRGHALSYAYRGGVLVQETNRNGVSFYFEYDWEHPEGYCVRTWGDGGIYERRITYDKHRHVTVVEDSRGGRTHYFGNAAGLVDRELDPTGRETRYAWDACCRKVAEVDGLGGRSEWAYDDRGNTVLERDALGRETRRRFDEMNLPVEVVDAAGETWRFAYSSRGKLLRAIDPLGHVSRIQQNRRGLVVAMEDALGRETTLRHDERGDLVESTDERGATTRFENDDMGRPVRQIDVRGAETALSWDACGRLERARHADGSEVRYVRDGEGNVIEQVDGLGNVTRFRYAGLNKLVERVDPEGGVVRHAYDTEESLVGVTNEVGEEYRFEVDLAGRVVKEIGFDGRRLEALYDRAGRCNELVRGDGKRTKIERDALGRIVWLRVPGPVPAGKVLPGVEEIEYGWDALGRMVRAKVGAADVVFERDALGQVIRERVGEVVIESRYDAAGERIGRTTSLGHEAAYEVDESGLLIGVELGRDPRFGDFAPESLSMGGPPVRAPWRMGLGRDATGAETERKLPGGVVSRWTRDRAGRPATHRVLGPSKQLAAVGYRWRSAEQLEALMDTPQGATRFAHDRRSYLMSALGPDGSAQYRLPDGVGNVFSTPERTDRAYGTGGRLMEADGIQYAHDAEGQLVEKALPDGSRWRYEWDGRGQLVEVTRPDGKKVAFAYDALGRRIRKTFEGRSTKYVWDGHDLVHEVTEGEALVTWEMDPGAFAPLAKVEGERRFGVVTDHLGTPKLLVDEAGEIAWKAQLDVFGVARVDVARTGCPWRWPGQYEDEETGLYYNRLRYYDPALGRYISQDPIGLLGGTALYGYVHDPLAWIDPFGLNCGKAGERIAKRFLEGEGYTIIGSLQNKSGHGIDIIARGKNGLLRFFEVKTTKGLVAPALSAAQKNGAQHFGLDRLNCAVKKLKAWNSVHDPSVRKMADNVLSEIKARGGSVTGDVIEVTLGNGGIRTRSW